MITLRVAGFDWDSANRSKCQKHGVPPSEVETLFRSDPLIAPDPKHSSEEDRMIAVGRTSTGRAIFVAFTLREKDGQRFIRTVTARYMHAREVKSFEEEGTPTED
jgi:uncharacterized DUF497 family protein